MLQNLLKQLLSYLKRLILLFGKNELPRIEDLDGSRNTESLPPKKESSQTQVGGSTSDGRPLEELIKEHLEKLAKERLEKLEKEVLSERPRTSSSKKENRWNPFKRKKKRKPTTKRPEVNREPPIEVGGEEEILIGGKFTENPSTEEVITEFNETFPDPYTADLTEMLSTQLQNKELDASTLQHLEHLAQQASNISKPQNLAGDPVRCSVYAPKTVQQEEEFLILAFAHLKEQEEEVAASALFFDPNMTKKGGKILNARVPKGHQLQFRLHFRDFEVEDNIQFIVWQGEASSVEFGVSIPGSYSKTTLIGTIYISQDGVPIGQIKFKLDIDGAVKTKHLAPTQAHRYEYAFVSYSSKDRQEVLKRTQMLEKVGVQFFQDVLDFNPGDRWEKGLYKNIDKCDVFLLFWSTHSKASKWVTKEWEYALARQGDDEMQTPDIIPIPLEGPPPPRPPDQLKHLHFNDTFLYFLKP